MSIKNGEIKGVKSTPPVGLENKNPLYTEQVSENDQEIPQSHTADQPMAPWGRAAEHL